ncbi:EamA family transporter [Amycolatopsis benzoatilytica]|uniref:EamA family transporter n=1 Tax=Amycolatopsis benzoatilytica TaxID=346045 RepID=UPI00037918AE|nr:EamA family transporter [Amycolatopsis benzoatilytica]
MTAELPLLAPPRAVHRGRGLVFVVLAAVLFSTSGSLAKPAMTAGLTPEQVATLRIGLAGVLLLAGTALFAPRALRIRRGEWPVLLGYGALGVAGTQLLYFIAAARIPVGIAILLEFMSPVLIALWVRVVRKKRLPGVLWLGIGLAMAGLALVAQVWQGLRLDFVGLLAGLGAAVCSAGYFLLGERALADREPLGLVTWGMVIGAVLVSVAAPPWTVPVKATVQTVPFGPWTPPLWLLLAGLVVLSTALAYLAGITALRHLPASVASVVGLVEPIAAAAFAWAFLGEALAWPQALGAVLLLSGAFLVQRRTAALA